MKNEVRNKNQSAFTLLEVLIAVVIFSIVMTALYSTFRVGLKAYRAGMDNMDEMQQARFIFDAVTRDVRAIYYLDESAYNVQANMRINTFRKEYLKNLQEGNEDEFLANYDTDMASLLGKEDADVKENPYNLGISIDLSMRGDDKDDKDTISFVRYQMNEIDMAPEPWGLARVSWTVENERLIRKEKSVFVGERNLDGEEVDPVPDRIDIIGKNIVSFNIKYGYFCADQWLEAPDWDSSDIFYRNPTPDIDPEDSEYDNVEKMRQTLPQDGIPAYMKIEITIADSKEKAKTEDIEGRRPRTFSTIVNFPSSQENFIPVLDEDSELYESTYGNLENRSKKNTQTADGDSVE